SVCNSLTNTNPGAAPIAAGSRRPTPSGIATVKKEKRTKKERRGQPDGNGRRCGQDQRTSILVHSGLEKPAGFSHRFHRHGGDEPKTTKPDRSFATKTGHFYLLLTAPRGTSKRHTAVKIRKTSQG